MQQVEKLLKQLDSDNSGKVDAKELMAALGGYGIDADVVKEFVEQHDKDGDGCLNKEELFNFFQSI